ncbi:MAG TPA: nucleotide sugar dehydrogenase [Vicinamibacterales bacterium]|nr:nucleotide sugar dehydrogenase [Vicinamibacterales bacterium]
MSESISMVGLGKLGLPLAACFSTCFETLGVDLDPLVVSAVNDGRSPWQEPGLAELIAATAGRSLRATTDHREAIARSTVTFVLVPTPSRTDGTFSSALLERALGGLAEALRHSSKDSHLFVISSTVMPGAIEATLIPLIERISGRREGEGFDVCYVPDFVALGETVKGFLHPELVVIGQRTSRAGDRVEALYRRMCRNEPHVARMSVASAEIAKVALNAYITVKITFANHLANICERVPGADVDAITHAIGTDSRISRRYFTGGLAFGGTCFPRDTVAYRALASVTGMTAPLIEATESINAAQNDHLFETVQSYRPRRVGVLGVAFRPDTPVVEASPSLDLVRRLRESGVCVTAYDPLARIDLGDGTAWSDLPEECLEGADVAVLMHRSAAMKKAVESFQAARPLTVIDCWRLLDAGAVDPNVTVRPLGRYAG